MSDGASLSRQLIDRKENAEHGLLTIEVELVCACKYALYFLARCGPTRGVGTAGEPPHRLVFAADDLLSAGLTPRRERRQASQELLLQFLGAAIGLLGVGAS